LSSALLREARVRAGVRARVRVRVRARARARVRVRAHPNPNPNPNLLEGSFGLATPGWWQPTHARSSSV